MGVYSYVFPAYRQLTIVFHLVTSLMPKSFWFRLDASRTLRLLALMLRLPRYVVNSFSAFDVSDGALVRFCEQKVGVKLDDKGRVVVNEKYQTNVPNIYALGDVIAGPMLAHKAEDEGVCVAEILAGQHGHVNYDVRFRVF